MAKQGRPVIDQLVPADALEQLLGVSHRNIKSLGIEPVMLDSKPCYPLNEVTQRSKRSMAKTFAGRVGTGEVMGKDSIRLAKLAEGAKKLRLANDDFESGLIDKERLADALADKIDAIKSIISEIPELVIELAPDIDPRAMAIVRSEVEAATDENLLGVANL